MASQDRTAHLSAGIIPVDATSITNPKDLVAVYSNNFGVSATMTDFTIYFLEIGQIPGEKGVTTSKQELKAIVTLPLLAASGLQQVLLQVQERAAELMKLAKANASVKK
jgi:hypothetical protein